MSIMRVLIRAGIEGCREEWRAGVEVIMEALTQKGFESSTYRTHFN